MKFFCIQTLQLFNDLANKLIQTTFEYPRTHIHTYYFSFALIRIWSWNRIICGQLSDIWVFSTNWVIIVSIHDEWGVKSFDPPTLPGWMFDENRKVIEIGRFFGSLLNHNWQQFLINKIQIEIINLIYMLLKLIIYW